MITNGIIETVHFQIWYSRKAGAIRTCLSGLAYLAIPHISSRTVAASHPSRGVVALNA